MKVRAKRTPRLSTANRDVSLRLVRSHLSLTRRTSQREVSLFTRNSLLDRGLDHGIGELGRGATPQMAVAHGGRGGVGISVSLPCVAAVPPVMQTPVKALMLG